MAEGVVLEVGADSGAVLVVDFLEVVEEEEEYLVFPGEQKNMKNIDGLWNYGLK